MPLGTSPAPGRKEERTAVTLYFQGHGHALGWPSLAFCTGHYMACELLSRVIAPFENTRLWLIV